MDTSRMTGFQIQQHQNKIRLKEQQNRMREEKLKLKEEELKLKDLAEQKIIELKIAEENKIKEENIKIKEWEIKFDAEQKRKEEELIRKFNDNNLQNKETTKKNLEEKVTEENKSIN